MSEGTMLPAEDMANLQILLEGTVHVGAALMTKNDGEPVVGRTLIAALVHRTNGSSHDLEPELTLYGLDEDTARQMLGGMIVGISLAYGHHVVDDVVRLADEFLERHPQGEHVD